MTMSNEMKPRLRLSPYKDDWEKFVLKDKASFSTGHGYSKNDLRTVGKPIILYGRLYTNYETIIRDVDTFVIEQPNSILSKGGEIIIPSSGETAEDISVASMIAKAGIIIGGGLNIIKTNEIEPAFLALLLTFGKPHKDLTKSAQGKTIVHLYNQDISQVDIVIPKTKEEQRTLAYFIDKMDSMIIRTEKELSKLQEVKKAYRSMLFPRPGEKKPQLRFKDFSEDWNSMPLSYYACKVTTKNTTGAVTESFTNSAEFGIVSQLDFFEHEITNESNNTNYFVVNEDDFVYNPRISSFAPVGPINRNKLGRKGIMSPLYMVFTIQGIEPMFLEYYFQTTLWHHYMKMNGNTGARHDRFSISDEKFFNMPIPTPCLEEQKAIGNMLYNIDKLISAQSRRIISLKRIKSACLDGMFVNE